MLSRSSPPRGADFDLTVSAPDATADLKLVFPFSPARSATTVLPARVTGDGVFHLPAIVSAPGYGQMLVTAPDGSDVTSRLVGRLISSFAAGTSFTWTAASRRRILHLGPPKPAATKACSPTATTSFKASFSKIRSFVPESTVPSRRSGTDTPGCSTFAQG